jgi:hypothetical protein
MSFHPRVWINPFLGVFKPLERSVLDYWISRAGEELRPVLESQMKEVTLVQRHQQKRVANLYKIKNGLFRENFSTRIPNSPREQNLGKLQIIAHSGTKLSVEFWAANGRLFSIEFCRSPGSDLQHADIEVLQCEYLPKPRLPQLGLLPGDYSDQVRLDNFVFKFEDIYEVRVQDERFWALAESPDVGLLGTKQETDDRAVYLLPYREKFPIKLSLSLGEAIKTARARAG